MKGWNLSRYALTSCIAGALLAACSGSQPPFGAPGAMPQNRTSRTLMSPLGNSGFETLYSFKGSQGLGANPNDLAAFHGMLYGTTRWGGPKANGTVFAMDTSGNERVVYFFKGGSDGMYPGGGVSVVNGVLYGTTAGGGNGCQTGPGGVEGCGTIYSVTISGKERVLHRFTWGSDGASPLSDLTVLNGKIYGVTWSGGRQRVCEDLTNGCGTVFEIGASGDGYRVVYRFKGRTDGALPEGTLLAFHGKLFGTTSSGGGINNCFGAACGTIFDVNTSGQEEVLARFKGGTDGGDPIAGLININDVLYGTTSEGGSECYGGCGTVFKATASGQETVLYSFKGAPDGEYPTSRLTAANGALYGTTPSGGNQCGATSGYTAGTIFELTLSGAEKILYPFKCWTPRDADGIFPSQPLLVIKQRLYGTTASGGRHYAGTAFALSL